jgi:hypothetical protein
MADFPRGRALPTAASPPPENPVKSPETADRVRPGWHRRARRGPDAPPASTGDRPTAVRRFDRPAPPPEDRPARPPDAAAERGPDPWREDSDVIIATNPLPDGDAPEADLRDLLGPGTTPEDLAVLR